MKNKSLWLNLSDASIDLSFVKFLFQPGRDYVVESQFRRIKEN
jgi:hypothetical protein